MNCMEQILTALRFLANNDPDFSREQNGVGYNHTDSAFGHELARREHLTLNQQRAALKMLTKYRGQLERGGLSLPESTQIAESDTPKLAGSIRVSGDMLKISFPYDAKLVEKVKSLPERRFDGYSKTWSVPVQHADMVIKLFPDFSVDPSITEAQVDAERARIEREIQAKAEREKLMAGLNLDALLPNGQTLYAHQKSAVTQMLERGWLILADDMGLGKTKSALVAARQYQLALQCGVFVIAPVSLRENWLREAEAVNCPIEVFSWAKVPEPPEETPYVLIADEAHYAQNLKSQRTQKMLDLAAKAKAVFLLTGTPIKNGRPVNLFPLLAATHHNLAQNKRRYEERYCNAHATRWTRWDTTGATHLDELHKKTSDVILRRMKKECLDLPPKTRVLRHVEFSTESRQQYDEAFNALRREYKARLASGEIMDGGEALVMLNHLRHAGSVAKVETAIEIAQEILEQGGSVVLFTEFQDSAEQIATKLGETVKVELLTGSVTGNETVDGEQHSKRQMMVDRFQAGESKAFVGTIKAGGVGITLTAANTVILVDRPWTPGDAVQAEDRLHRIGQHANVTALWLQANGTDEAIDAILEQKDERIQLILAGKRKTLRGVGSIGEIAQELARAIFSEED